MVTSARVVGLPLAAHSMPPLIPCAEIVEKRCQRSSPPCASIASFASFSIVILLWSYGAAARQSHAESRSFRCGGLNRDRPAMRGHDLSGDVQTEAEPARGGSVASVSAAAERLEQDGDLLPLDR